MLAEKIDFQCSGWLSVIPVAGKHFDMSPNEFRDAVALCYGRTPIDLPTHCDADGEVFSVNHALNCSKGGLVYGRHNELRALDLNCSLLELAGLINKLFLSPLYMKLLINSYELIGLLEVSGNPKSKHFLLLHSEC